MSSRNASRKLVPMACVGLWFTACADDGAALVTPDARADVVPATSPPPADADAAPVLSVDALTCDEIGDRWRALLSAPSVSSCSSDEDCASVGGSSGCGCGHGIAGCGVGVNAAAFQASDGPALASRHEQLQCPYGAACDCGTVHHRCVSGTCQSSPSGCTLGGVPSGS